MKEAFQESNYLLTAALGVGLDTINAGYDIPELSKYLDYMHVMAYDYHGSWDRKVLPNSPLRAGDNLDVVMHLDRLQWVSSTVDEIHIEWNFCLGGYTQLLLK